MSSLVGGGGVGVGGGGHKVFFCILHILRVTVRVDFLKSYKE